MDRSRLQRAIAAARAIPEAANLDALAYHVEQLARLDQSRPPPVWGGKGEEAGGQGHIVGTGTATSSSGRTDTPVSASMRGSRFWFSAAAAPPTEKRSPSHDSDSE